MIPRRSYSLATALGSLRMRSIVLTCRQFSSPPAVADAEKAPAAGTPVKAVETAKPLEKVHTQVSPAVAPVRSAGSAWQRAVAFAVGVAVSSVYFYTNLRDDVEVSSAIIEERISAAKADSVVVNEELRKRIAVLEHEVDAMKKK